MIPLEHEKGVPEYYNYLVACKNVAFLEIDEQIDLLNNLSEGAQKVLANAICGFIQMTGYIDAKWVNFRPTGNKVVYQGETICEIAVIDTEPFGLITDESDEPQPLYNEIDFPNNPERERRISLEVAVRYGLREFSQQCDHFGLKSMKEVADSYLSKV